MLKSMIWVRDLLTWTKFINETEKYLSKSGLHSSCKNAEFELGFSSGDKSQDQINLSSSIL